jgi:hypothetical protein
MNAQTQPQQVQVQPEQVQAAAQAGVKLLMDDARISIPPSMAQDGTFVLLTGLLQALATGQAVLGNPVDAEPEGGEGSGEPQE